MMKNIALFLLLIGALSLGACTTSGGTNTTPVAATGAQTVGNDQGTAQATESGSATNTNSPVIMNLFGAKKVTIKKGDDGVEAEIKGQADAEVTVSGAQFGNQTFGDDAQSAEISSGGGSAGAAGASASKTTESSRNGGVVKPKPITPPVDPGGSGN